MMSVTGTLTVVVVMLMVVVSAIHLHPAGISERVHAKGHRHGGETLHGQPQHHHNQQETTPDAHGPEYTPKCSVSDTHRALRACATHFPFPLGFLCPKLTLFASMTAGDLLR
jgi:hypothetical protein